MNKLTLVVDERELSTIRAALLLLQEHVDALPEDLAEMTTTHGAPMMASEIEHLSLRLRETARPVRDYAERELPQATRLVEVERFPGVPIPKAECERWRSTKGVNRDCAKNPDDPGPVPQTASQQRN